MQQDLADQDVLWTVRAAGPNNEEGRRRAALIEVLVNAINEKNPKRKQAFPSPTEYYVAALSTLATQVTSTAPSEESSVVNGDILYVLSKVIPHVPMAVARLDSDAALASILAATGRTANLGTRSGVACLAGLLNAQAKETWGRPIVVKSFRACLSKVVDDNPKVRKAAQESSLRVLAEGTAAAQIFQLFQEFIQGILGSSSSSERTILKTLHFCCLAAPHLERNTKVLRTVEISVLEFIEHSTGGDLINQALRALIELIQGDRRDGDNNEEEDEYFAPLIERLIRCFKFSKFPVDHWGKALAVISEKTSKGQDIAGKSILQVLRDEKLSEAEGSSLVSSLLVIVSSASLSRDGAVALSEHFLSIGLHMQSQHAWEKTLVVFAQIVDSDKLDSDDDLGLLTRIAKRAVESRESLVDWKTGEEKTDAPWKRGMEQLISACAGKMGPDAFFQAIPLFISKDDQNLNPARLCLFKALREAWRNPSNDLVRLATFKATILRLAKFCEDSASKAESDGMLANAKMYHMRTTQLWGLLPAFCSGASDVPDAFPPIAKMLASAMQDKKLSELCPIVAQSLVALIRSAIGFETFDSSAMTEGETIDAATRFDKTTVRNMEDDDEDGDENEDNDEEDEDDEVLQATRDSSTRIRREVQRRSRTAEEIERDCAVIRKFVPNYLPLFFNEYDVAYRAQAQARSQALCAAMEALVRIADAKFVTATAKQLVQKLLVAINNDDFATAKILLSIASAIASGFGEEEAEIVLGAIKPFITEEAAADDEGVQKRAFVCLMRLLRAPRLKDFVAAKREELVDMLQQSLIVKTKSSVKATRLICLRQLLFATSTDSAALEVTDLSNELLGEVLLSFKESNSQTRQAGFDLFSDMANRMDEAQRQKEFWEMTVAGLVATTPHMRSCTILAVCRLVAMFGDRLDLAELNSLVVLACLDLFAEKSREVARSLISLCKVCAIKLEPDALTNRVLTSLLTGLLPWSLDTKNRFSSKIRVVFDKLIKRIGLDAVLAPGVVPPDHRVLAYVKRQQTQKRNRRNSLDGPQSRGKRGDDSNLEITQRASDPVNLLDPSSLANVKRSRRTQDDDDDEKDDFKRDDRGRIIIPDDEGASRQINAKKRSRATKEDNDDESRETMSEDEEDHQPTSLGGKKDQVRRKKKVQQEFGREFKARKAGGDAKYKGTKMDPYAYIPLDHRMLNKRKKHQAVNKFVGVGKGGKRGYKKRSGSSA